MTDSAAARQPGEVTRLLERASRGDPEAFDRVFGLVYEELERLAHNRLRFEQAGHTLETGALVHEAYVRLVGQTRTEWNDSQHFFAVASEAMRRILVDHARRRCAAKRGDGAVRVPLDEARDMRPSDSPYPDDHAVELLALDDALTRLAEFNPRGVQIAQYRYFAGLTIAEICDILGLSERTVRRAWSVAKAWLRRELQDEADGGATG